MIVRVMDVAQREYREGEEGRRHPTPRAAGRLQRKVREHNATGDLVAEREGQPWLAGQSGEAGDAQGGLVLVPLRPVRSWPHSIGYASWESPGPETSVPSCWRRVSKDLSSTSRKHTRWRRATNPSGSVHGRELSASKQPGWSYLGLAMVTLDRREGTRARGHVGSSPTLCEPSMACSLLLGFTTPPLFSDARNRPGVGYIDRGKRAWTQVWTRG